jgi:hypothetical protein
VNVGIIRKELPEKNRYTNFKNIETTTLENTSETILKQFVVFIQLHYLRNKENKFSPEKNNIVPYFIGHNANTFLSIYWEPEILIDNKTGKTIDDKSIVAVMTSRPLTVTICNDVNINNAIFDVYYVDYLCVHKNWRKKNIAPQMIQTHEYNQSYQNRNICTSLFKREEELTGIVPLTVYKSYCFNMRSWNQPPLFDSHISLLTGDQQNMYYFYNFINEQTTNHKINKISKWDITIIPSLSNIIELVKTKNLFIKMLVIDGNVEAAYVFKKTCTFIEKDKEIISCIASIRSATFSESEFIHGFKVALWSIITVHKLFHYLVIEDISDNQCILSNISIKTHPFIVSPTAYFFYNFAYSTFKSDKCLIIN